MVPREPNPAARIENNLAADVAGWMGGPSGTALVLQALAGYIFYFYGRAIRAIVVGRRQAGAPGEAGGIAGHDAAVAG